MHAVLLAAGYGTRLTRDIDAAGEAWVHLRGLPKPLVPVGGRALATRWADAIAGTPSGGKADVNADEKDGDDLNACHVEKLE
jgi:choline kinase